MTRVKSLWGAVMTVAYDRQVVAVTDNELAGWTANLDNTGSQQVTGPCPRCQDPTTETIQSPEVIVAAFTSADVKQVSSLTHLIDCACRQPHTGRPPSISEGCGGEWLITITEGSTGPKVSAGDITMLGAAKAFNDASANELSVVRGLAKNWVQGVAALLGLFSLAGLVFTATAVSGLSPGYQIGFAACAATAFAAAAVGTYLAYRAAFGWPKSSAVKTDADLRAFYSNPHARAKDAANFMKLGVASTFLSIAALGAAILVLWFGTPASPPSPLVMITSSDGSQPCGYLLPAGSDGTVNVRKSDGQVVPTAPGKVTTVTTVSSCPG